MRKKWMRVTALLTASALVGVCGYRIANMCLDDSEFFYGSVYADDDELYQNMINTRKLGSELWTVGMMYLRNLDENGKLTGTSDFIKNTRLEMQRLGLMNEKGQITIDDFGKFEYRVSWEDNEISNTEKTDNEFEKKYTTSFQSSTEEPAEYMYGYAAINENEAYDTNYGATIYKFYGDMGHLRSVVYDFDTEGLPHWYIDDAKYYYRTDGTTLVPDNFVSDYGIRYNVHEEYYDDGSVYTVWEDEDGSRHMEQITDSVEEPYGTAVSGQAVETTVSSTTTVSTTTTTVDIYNYDSVTENNKKFNAFAIDTYPLKIYITPNQNIINELAAQTTEKEARNKEISKNMIETLPFAAAAAILILYLLWAGGYDNDKKRYVMGDFDHCFAEVPIAAMCISGTLIPTIFLSDIFPNIKSAFEYSYNSTAGVPIVIGVSYALLAALFIGMTNSIMVRLKCKSFLRTCLCVKIIKWVWRKIKAILRWIKKAFAVRHKVHELRQQAHHDVLSRKFIFRTIATILLTILSPVMGGMTVVFAPLIIAAFAILTLRDLRAYTELSKHITALSEGDYTKHEVPETSLIYTQTEKLNNISAGMQNSVDKQVKAERMKIDLVTNVSHDLKTPLTSIISYIDLLAQEDLDPASKDLVNVIQQKAERLKIMVSDVFDLAKATSRTDVTLEDIDEVILVGQVLGDMEDKISAYGKEIRTDIQAKDAPIKADGKKLYRVLQNLIDNALKYSLEGTRIWLTLRKESGYAVLTVRNTASYEMKFSADEITERFVRGDEARTSEGSGLGLSIARSFTEACGGEFRVSIEGDVFSAEVKIPLN